MSAATTFKVYLLVLAFATSYGMTSVVAGRYTSQASCEQASQLVQNAPRASNTALSAICVPSEE